MTAAEFQQAQAAAAPTSQPQHHEFRTSPKASSGGVRKHLEDFVVCSPSLLPVIREEPPCTSPPCCCPSSRIWSESIWPGLGILGESYLLFSFGTLRPIWELLYPSCFETNDDNNSNNNDYYDDSVAEICPPELIPYLNYSMVIGVMVGSIVLGYYANNMGRRMGSIVAALLMCFGACGLTLVSLVMVTSNQQQQQNPVILFRTLAVLFFIFGCGVGGEYPLAASSAVEQVMAGDVIGDDIPHSKSAVDQIIMEMPSHASRIFSAGYYERMHDAGSTTAQAQATLSQQRWSTYHQQRHRGSSVQMLFSMQGVGIFLNSIIITALLVLAKQGKARVLGVDNNGGDFDPYLLVLIWRIVYASGAVILGYVLYSRVRFLTESSVWANDKMRRDKIPRSSLLRQVSSSRSQTNNNTEMGGRRQYRSNQQQLEKPLDLVPSLSEVSSLSCPSVTVDYHNQAIHTTGLVGTGSFIDDVQERDPNKSGAGCHGSREENPYPCITLAPSTDPEDDLKASPLRLLCRNYGLRLTGASLSWLLWDIAFYGNHLFQSTFLMTLSTNSGDDSSMTLLGVSLASTMNAAVALMGYVGAAFLVDRWGRRNLQLWGFLMTGSLFVTSGFLYHQLPTSVLVGLYFASTLCGQLGPNATTFLIPGELFPTEMRTLCHGVCTAFGKLGALAAAVLFHSYYVSGDEDAEESYNATELDLFLISGYASFAACIITFTTIPETLGLDLFEVDRRWSMILEGRKADYQGGASHPKFLSYYERSKLYGQTHDDMY